MIQSGGYMHFRGLLFDLDGTLVNSLEFVEASWSAWAVRRGYSAQAVRHYLHGKPALSTLRHFMSDASEAAITQEFLALEEYEASHAQGMTAVAGAVAFLRQLNALNVPWGIVTSGSRKVASARIHHAGLPFPDVLVTSEDITYGKPASGTLPVGGETPEMCRSPSASYLRILTLGCCRPRRRKAWLSKSSHRRPGFMI
ncbi:Phosphatase YfbT [Kluyvera cryocrescens]|uniref:Phosphatase YfbT n=1 Tax=Kluyvera cryocrescens TaxID=580 RepID=A0A485ACG2_KLUCR|nr:Phosphatase YfbT [Kluyvera cryocrescens]